jgi:hypothetical protein
MHKLLTLRIILNAKDYSTIILANLNNKTITKIKNYIFVVQR